MQTVLITGSTGFIGSNITRTLLERGGYRVFATHRYNSKFNRCIDYYDKVNWINTEDTKWQELFLDFKIDIIIHTAWQGVSANEREDWEVQYSNFIFSKQLFEFARDKEVPKIIVLGSQAEYGIYGDKVNEDKIPFPTESYGIVKLLTLYYLKNIAEKKNIDWYWIRVFSVYGRDENDNWLLPSVIKSLLSGNPIELTKGLQKYDYLHIEEFVNSLLKVVDCESNFSGVYNICSGIPIEIKTLIQKISLLIPGSEPLLKFGAIPYRKNQNMYMVGENKKFERVFGPIYKCDMDSNLMKTIKLYKEQTK